MTTDFKDQIKQLGERVAKLKDQIQTEEATKNAFIMPFIQALGYDVFNPTEVVPEFISDIGLKKGEKIDYSAAARLVAELHLLRRILRFLLHWCRINIYSAFANYRKHAKQITTVYLKLIFYKCGKQLHGNVCQRQTDKCLPIAKSTAKEPSGRKETILK